MNVVHPDDAAQHLHPVEVVHGEDGAPLVHVAQEAEALALARVMVANEVNVNLR